MATKHAAASVGARKRPNDGDSLEPSGSAISFFGTAKDLLGRIFKRRKVDDVPSDTTTAFAGPAKDANAVAGTAAEAVLQVTEHALCSDILSKAFMYVDVSEVSAISQTSKRWNDALDSIEDYHWKCLAEKHHPTLKRLMQILPDTCDPLPSVAEIHNNATAAEGGPCGPPYKWTSLTSRNWKEMFRRAATSSYKPIELNQQIQKDFEMLFREEGIVAFSNCCSYGCSLGYNWTFKDGDMVPDPTFKPKERGIFFFRLHLNGMYYEENPTEVAASYHCFDCLYEHWEEECDLIEKWCAVLGLMPGEFRIEKPKTDEECVLIHFLKPVRLQEGTWSDGYSNPDYSTSEEIDSDIASYGSE